MPHLNFNLKIKILRIVLGLMILGWIIDVSSEYHLFFTSALIEKNHNNIFAWFFSSKTIGIALVLSLCLSLAFMIGYRSKSLGFALGVAMISLFQINPMLYSPALPFQIWLVFALSLLSGPAQASKQTKLILYIGAWVILAAGYFIGGLDKFLHSESWRDGTALHFILSGPLARFSQIYILFQKLPNFVMKLFTWSIPALEILFLPLSLHRITRAWAWWIMSSVHLLILSLLWLPSVSLGMLLFHFFLVDSGEVAAGN